MRNILFYLAANGFFVFSIYLFLGVYFDREKISKKIELLSYGSYFIVGSIAFIFFHMPFLNLLITIFSLFSFVQLYPGARSKKFLAGLGIYALAMALDTVIFVLIYNPESELIYLGALSTLGVGIGLSVIAFFLQKIKGQSSTGLLLMPLGNIVVIMLCVYYVNSSVVLIAIALLLAFISGLVFHIFHVLDQYHHMENLQQGLAQQNQAYSHEMKLMQQEEQKLAALRHDMKNHLAVISQFAKEGKNQELEAYIEQFSRTVQTSKRLIQSGNPEIDSVLNYKLKQAQLEGAILEFSATLPSKISMDTFDFNIIMGNLLDNAREAIVKCEEKKLSLVLRQVIGVLYIYVENTYDGQLKRSSSHYKTRKGDFVSHGIGLIAVKQVVDRYHGEMKIAHDNKIFQVEIMLYLPDATDFAL